MEEVDDDEMTTQIRSGILDDANAIMEEIVEKHFIRKIETEGMPKLCQDSDDDEENEDDDEILVFQIKNRKKAHYIVSTTKLILWRTKDLNPQMKDGKSKTAEEIVLKCFHKFMKVFSKKASEWMLIRKPWDHAIEMKPRYEPKKVKNIPLLPQEQKEVEEFLNDQLSKRYI